MAAELEHKFIDYKASLSTIVALEKRESIQAGREAENIFVDTILRIQQTLQSGQALVMRVALAERDEDYEELEGYAGVVHDAPHDLLTLIRKEIELKRIQVEGVEGNKFPDEIEIVIPQNVIPKNDDDVQSSSSRAVLMSGKVQRFLSFASVRNIYLEVVPTGFSWDGVFHMHPSVIRGLKIDDVPSSSDTKPKIIFRAVKKTE